MDFRQILAARAGQAGLALSQQQLEQFQLYYDLLLETNQVMNLTAITEPEGVAVKHIVDSLLAFEPGFAGKKLADVGSGAGFPGLPLKIYCPSLQVVLIDSLAKRLRFLARVVAALGLTGVSLLHSRVEDLGRLPGQREAYQVVTARAVARFSVLAEYCLPLVELGGSFIALKGGNYQAELAAAGRALRTLGGRVAAVREFQLPGLGEGRAIIKVVKVGKTPSAYPRRAGLALKQPLEGRED